MRSLFPGHYRLLLGSHSGAGARGVATEVWLGSPHKPDSDTRQSSETGDREQYWSEGGGHQPPSSPSWPETMTPCHGTRNTEHCIAQTHSLPNQNQNLIIIHSCLCSFIDYKRNRSSSTKYGFDWRHLISYTIKSKPKLSNVCSMNKFLFILVSKFLCDWLFTGSR